MSQIKRMFFWLFHRFDYGHCLIGPLNVAIWAIYPCIGTAALAFLAGIGFMGYQIWESSKKGDDGYPELKGWLFGLMATGILVSIVYRVID